MDRERHQVLKQKAEVPFSESSPSGKAGSQCTRHGYTKVDWQNEFLQILQGSCPEATREVEKSEKAFLHKNGLENIACYLC